jgi:hypothetical protein
MLPCCRPLEPAQRPAAPIIRRKGVLHKRAAAFMPSAAGHFLVN